MSQDALLAQRLRRRIEVQRRRTPPARDPDGGERHEYEHRCYLNAELLSMTGREAMLAQQMAPSAQLVFRVRYRTDIAMTDRVLWKGVVYEVVYAAEEGRNVALKLYVKRPGGEASSEP